MKLIALRLLIIVNLEQNAIKYLLDNISGIGVKRRKSLFEHFETIQNIKNASVDELMAVPGISEQIAKSIYNFFRTHELVSSKLK